jgi:hypothetical protein
MELAKLYRRVVGLDVHRAKITALRLRWMRRVRRAWNWRSSADSSVTARRWRCGLPRTSPTGSPSRARASTERAPYEALQKTGIDASGAVLLLVEFGDNMTVFGSVDRLASGWVSARATTSPPASGRPGESEKAIPRSDARYASLLTPPVVPDVLSSPSSRPYARDEATAVLERLHFRWLHFDW